MLLVELNLKLFLDLSRRDYFDIEDFSRIYENHDEIVDALQYGTANLTWSKLCKSVEEFKKEDKKSFWAKW